MGKETSRNIRVGLFVLIGTAFIIFGMYFIGDKQNIFGSTFHLKANFFNVRGLMPGNNVRFGGINVGTVENVEIINDSTINVVMVIKENLKNFIKKNSIASIGTDGLMGNKLININTVHQPSAMVSDGDELQTLHPIETDDMMRTLNRTNEDVSVIAKNLKKITERINSHKSVWSILMDSIVAENVKDAIVNIQLTSSNTAIITGDLTKIIEEVKLGKGTVGALLTDTTLENRLNQTIVNIKLVSDSLAHITGDLSDVTRKIKNGEGAIGTILMDTTFVHNLNKSMENIRSGSKGFDENMEALKHSFLLRDYFRKQEKKNQSGK